MLRRFHSTTRTTIAGIVLASCLTAAPLFGQAASAPAAAPTKVMIAPAKVLDLMLSHYEDEFVSLAEAMPADKYDFAPTNQQFPKGQFQGVRTFAEQIKHVTEVNYGLFAGMSSTPPPKLDMASLKTKEQMVTALKGSFTYMHQAIATITPENAFESLGGKWSATRAGTVTFVVGHGFDHYGQLVEYLRMNGIVPPASKK